MDELQITLHISVEDGRSVRVRSVAADGRRKPGTRRAIRLRAMPAPSLIENIRLVFIDRRRKPSKCARASVLRRFGAQQLRLPLE